MPQSGKPCVPTQSVGTRTVQNASETEAEFPSQEGNLAASPQKFYPEFTLLTTKGFQGLDF
jgi:hypothetical protein